MLERFSDETRKELLALRSSVRLCMRLVSDFLIKSELLAYVFVHTFVLNVADMGKIVRKTPIPIKPLEI